MDETIRQLESRRNDLLEQIEAKTAALERIRRGGNADEPNRRPARFVGTRAASAGGALVPAARKPRGGAAAAPDMPRDIAENPELDKVVAAWLPSHYNFEIKKTLWRIRKSGARRVALQMPEGLLMFGCALADLFEKFAGVECLIMGDVTYGACCVDDFGARAMNCQLLVHYGHSCLVPVDVTRGETGMETMYVFVDIAINVAHLAACLKLEFPRGSRLVLMGTIQFVGGLYAAQDLLKDDFALDIPQARPLSGGEVLGCTSPSVDSSQADALVFVSDGRFHLESAMIANPNLVAYRYDPYAKVLTRETYDLDLLKRVRGHAVTRARAAKKWGLIQGTLGRQGNPKIVQRILKLLERRGLEVMLVLLSEITPHKLLLMEVEVEAWVQVACPRLSVDWGEAFSKPLLTPYEAFVALGEDEWLKEGKYPQDYYAKGGGKWGNYYEGD